MYDCCLLGSRIRICFTLQILKNQDDAKKCTPTIRDSYCPKLLLLDHHSRFEHSSLHRSDHPKSHLVRSDLLLTIIFKKCFQKHDLTKRRLNVVVQLSEAGWKYPKKEKKNLQLHVLTMLKKSNNILIRMIPSVEGLKIRGTLHFSNF